MKRSAPNREGCRAEKALKRAVRKVIEEGLGLPVAVMRNGKPVLIPGRPRSLYIKKARREIADGHEREFLLKFARDQRREHSSSN